MRIAQCNDAFIPILDGVGRVVYEYADGLARRGHEIYVIAPFSDAGYRAQYPFDILDFASIKLPGAAQLRTGVATMDRHYVMRAEKTDFDLVHVHSPAFSGMEGIRLANKKNVPLVGTFHSRYYDDFLRYSHSESIANLGVKYIVDFYDRCDEVWAVSGAAAAELRDYGYKGHIYVIPHGTRPYVVTDANRASAREAFGLDERPVLLYVGQIDWKKNLRLSLEAMALLREKGVPFQFVLAGRGPSMEPVRECVRELRLEGNVRFTGHITDNSLLSGLYGNAQVFVFPSSYDTAGLVVRESAVAGVASIVLEGSAPAECIRDGENGFTCKDDPADLCNVLQYALEHPAQLKQIGNAAQTTIPQSWDSILDQVEDRYRMLVEARFSTLKRKRGLFRKELDAVDKTLEKRKATLMWRFLSQDLQNVYAYDYAKQKQSARREDVLVPLPRATPESQGIRSKDLLAFFHALDADPIANPHALMVLRHGHVVAEGYWAPYEKALPHQLYSLSKSIVSTAIGMLVEEGRLLLSERLVDLFADKVPMPDTHPMKEVTVWHLLTMSTGVRFDEVGTALGVDWEQEFLDSGVKFAAGTQFAYNSMNTYMLSAIVRRKTGQGLLAYLKPRLFDPLGIHEVSWEVCPMGTEKGGWGLSLRLEDVAKIGQLYLQMGVYEVNGQMRRLLSCEWIKEATSVQIATPNGECKDGYGYQIWMAPIPGAYLFNGAFGQYLLMLPNEGVVVALFSGTARLFAKSELTYLSQKSIVNAAPAPLPANDAFERMLQGATASLSHLDEQTLEEYGAIPLSMDFLLTHFGGATYTFKHNTSGIIPMVIQAVHNNFSVGISSIRFDAEKLAVTFTEGENSNTLPIPQSGFARATVLIREEPHEVAVGALAGMTVEGEVLLRLYLYFLETPCTRIMTFLFTDNRLRVELDERPSVKDAMTMLLELSGTSQWELNRALVPILKRERLQNRLRSFVTPYIEGEHTLDGQHIR